MPALVISVERKEGSSFPPFYHDDMVAVCGNVSTVERHDIGHLTLGLGLANLGIAGCARLERKGHRLKLSIQTSLGLPS